MALSYVEYTGDGFTTDFAVSMPYIEKSHIKVSVDGTDVTFTWVNDGLIRCDEAPAEGSTVRVYRETKKDARYVDYQDGTTIKESDLDKEGNQSFFLAQEAYDNLSDAKVYAEKAEEWAENPEDEEVETGKYSALHHAAKASASASAAATSASNAAASESNAATSASNAATSEANALTYKNAAETAKTGAETARDKAEDWAEEAEDVEVEAGKYSALHWAAKAEGFYENMVKAVFNEVPGGSINGTNTSFTTANAFVSGSLVVVQNGLTLKSGTDFTEGNGTFTMTEAPLTGDVLVVHYLVPGGTGAVPVSAPKGYRDGCRPEWKSNDDIYINPGVIEINGTIVTVSSQITVTWTDLDQGSETSGWYYLYLDTGGSPHISVTAPSAGFKNRYHPSHSDWRCVGSFLNSGALHITKAYYREDGWTQWDLATHGNIANGTTPSTTWTDANCANGASAITKEVDVYYKVHIGAASSVIVAVRVKGSTSNGNEILHAVGTGSYDPSAQVRFTMDVDSTQKFQYHYTTGVSASTYITCHGYREDV